MTSSIEVIPNPTSIQLQNLNKNFEIDLNNPGLTMV